MDVFFHYNLSFISNIGFDCMKFITFIFSLIISFINLFRKNIYLQIILTKCVNQTSNKCLTSGKLRNRKQHFPEFWVATFALSVT